ncbi:hypothetical protein EXS66_02445 [Candidatus Saccharibacteria bacterium]|nr:hypothetical protein [Candidatus Saccharibacteria bacterium]
MKRKNVIVIISSVVVFTIALGLMYRFLFPPTADSNITYVVPHPVQPNFDEKQLLVLNKDVIDYTIIIKPQTYSPSNLQIETIKALSYVDKD